MTTKIKARIAKCSHCSVQCWQLTELDFAVNQLLFFSYYYSFSYWLFFSYSYCYYELELHCRQVARKKSVTISLSSATTTPSSAIVIHVAYVVYDTHLRAASVLSYLVSDSKLTAHLSFLLSGRVQFTTAYTTEPPHAAASTHRLSLSCHRPNS